MGNILGKAFNPKVKKQIDIRQQALGEYSSLEPKILQYYSTKTPFIRLASSVDLKDQTSNGEVIKDSVLEKMAKSFSKGEIKGNELAKNFILQGGASDLNSEELKSGINTSNSTFQGAYGWGGIDERGFIPLPGVTDVDIQHLNNGALTKTTINIKCFSRKQFQLIDVLYLRPGYSLLLEYGWSVYLGNDNSLKNVNVYRTEPLEKLLNTDGVNQYEMYKAIENEEEKHSYNYGAVFGKISKFKWQFNPDGSYDCLIQLTSMGDVIESLKTNIVSSTVSIPTILNPNYKPPPLPQLAPKNNKTALHTELYRIEEVVNKSQGSNKTILTDYEITDWLKLEDDGKFTPTPVTVEKGILSVANVSDAEGATPTVYITLGVLLLYIESRLLLYNNEESSKSPLIKFDIDFENLQEDENFIYCFPGQFSADPKVCLIPYEDAKIEGLDLDYSEIEDYELNTTLKKQTTWKKEDSDYLRRLTSIYVSTRHITNILDNSPKNEDGSLFLIDFLNILLKNITTVIGGVNKIRIQVSHDSLIKFHEDIPQNVNEVTPDEHARFKVFGVHKNTGGSFIKDVSLVSELSNDYTTQIVIGAQVNGNQPHENATSFTKYNSGLQDRIIPSKSSYKGKSKNIKDLVKSEFNDNINPNLGSILKKVYKDTNFNDDNTKYLVEHNLEYSNLLTGELVKDYKINSPAFLPFNLSLTMGGLSGMVLYQKFKITDDILPISYENDQIDLIIKGINHKIDVNDWVTKVDSLSTPAFKEDPSSPTSTNDPTTSNSTKTEQKEDYVCNNPTIIDFPIPEPSTNSSEAMRKSYELVFRKIGGTGGISLCARWVYNLARFYTFYLQNKEPEATLVPSGGDANSIGFHQKLTTFLNYKKKMIARNVDKNTLKSLIINNSDSLNYGDILVYYSNDSAPREGDGNDNPYKYGHAQIKVNNSVGWACDKELNHGHKFVYKTRDQKCWNLIYFAAPQ